MPIYRQLQDEVFDPEHIAAMVTAFEDSLAKLGLNDRADPLVEIVAKRVIEVAQMGERDPSRLRDMTLQALTGDTKP
jgi:hypothetical protein